MFSVVDNGPFRPCPHPFNMAAHVLAQADRMGDKPALCVLGRETVETWRYHQLKSAILGTATGFLNAGLVPGDRVLIRLGNSVEFPIAYLAAIAVGLIPVPTSVQLTTPELNHLMPTLRPAATLAGPGISLPDQTGLLITQDQLGAFRTLPAAAYQMGDSNRPAYIVYTSGTSGRARGVVHAHRAVWARQMMWQGWYGLTPDDRLLHAGAFNWTYTLGTGLIDPLSIGATALIPQPGLDAGDLAQLLARHEATIFAAAPGVYRRLLREAGDLDLPKLRHGLSAGEKMAQGIRHDWQARTGTQIHEAYGMSECSTFISGAPDHPATPGTSGRPQPGRRVALLDPAGDPAAMGDEGEIAVSRDDPGLMLGYLDAPDETAARMHGTWFLTGDRARMDPDGGLTYLGRNDDMMNAGGFRVSPLEVERAFADCAGLGDCAAVELEVKADTTVIALFYEAEAALDPDAMTAHAQARLAHYKTPRIFKHISTLPRAANGKISRKALRETP